MASAVGGAGPRVPVSPGWRSRPPSLLGGRRAAGGLAALRLRVALSWSCRVAVVLSSCRRRLRRSCRRRRLGSPPLVAPCPLTVGVARSHLASTALLLLGWGLGISSPHPRRCVVAGGWGRSSPFPAFWCSLVWWCWRWVGAGGLVLVRFSIFGPWLQLLLLLLLPACCSGDHGVRVRSSSSTSGGSRRKRKRRKSSHEPSLVGGGHPAPSALLGSAAPPLVAGRFVRG